MTKKLLLLAALAFTIAACTTVPTSPAQSVYAMHSKYAAALQIAIAYKNLPLCTTGVKLCSKPEVVVKLQAADEVAFPAITAAQNIVRAPELGLNAASAITIANEAIKVMLAITSTLQVKP
jgi:hypothetical protein